MSQSEGFILPLMLILLLILSLLITELYQAEQAHLAVLQTIIAQNNEPDLNKIENQALKQAAFLSSNTAHPVPDPSNNPQPGRLYLRAFDPSTHVRIWQEQMNSYRLEIKCSSADHCISTRATIENLN